MKSWTCMAVVLTAALAAIFSAADAVDPGAAASQPSAGVFVEIDLSTPQAAVETFLRSWQSGSKASENLKRCIVLAGAKAKVVENDMNHRLWRNYVERAAIAKYGAADGIKVLGNARGCDEQIEIDVKRAKFANADQDPIEKGLTRVYLKPEKESVWGTDPGEFGPRGTYVLRQVGKEWKIDYVMTYELDSQARTEGNRDALDAALYPRINKTLQAVAEGIKKGEYPTADDAKAVVESAWEKAYNAATGNKGDADKPDKPEEPKAVDPK